MSAADRLRVTGDGYAAAAEEAHEQWSRRPDSVYLYAVWQALSQVAGFWAGEQGLPARLALEIDRAAAEPVQRILADGFSETPASRAELTRLLRNLANLDQAKAELSTALWPRTERHNTV